MTFHVDSEVGRLRQVVLHRPGLELTRLTPQNVHELLFDDVMWAQRAREEHDAFAQKLRDKGVTARVVAGGAYGARSPVVTSTSTSRASRSSAVARPITRSACGHIVRTGTTVWRGSTVPDAASALRMPPRPPKAAAETPAAVRLKRRRRPIIKPLMSVSSTIVLLLYALSNFSDQASQLAHFLPIQ